MQGTEGDRVLSLSTVKEFIVRGYRHECTVPYFKVRQLKNISYHCMFSEMKDEGSAPHHTLNFSLLA
jgi:hypothetical protein